MFSCFESELNYVSKTFNETLFKKPIIFPAKNKNETIQIYVQVSITSLMSKENAQRNTY